MEGGQAVMQAGPELVTQLALLWCETEPLPGLLAWPPRPATGWAALQLAALALSFISVNLGAWRAGGGAALRTATPVLLRAWLLSSAAAVSPLSAGLAGLVLLLCCGLAECLVPGQEGRTDSSMVGPRLLAGPAGILSPARPAGLPGLLLHLTANTLLLAGQLALLELQPGPLPALLHHREVTHTVSCLLWLAAATAMAAHWVRFRRAAKASRTWAALSPRSASPAPPASPGPARPLAQSTPARPVSPASRATSPGPGRPCSQLYPYLPSAPAALSGPARSVYPGGSRCGEESCTACARLREGPTFTSSSTGKQYKLMTPVTCTDMDIVFLVTCGRCSKQYCGWSAGDLQQVNLEQRREVEGGDTLLGRHFAAVCGYQVSHIYIGTYVHCRLQTAII